MRSYRDIQRRLTRLERPAAGPVDLAYVVLDADGELASARDTAGRLVDRDRAAAALARPGRAVKAYTTDASPESWPDAV